MQVVNNGIHRSLCAASEIHRIAPRSDVLHSLGEDGAGEDGGGGGPVTGDFVRLVGDVLQEASTQVLEFVLEGDGFCDSDAI